MRKTLIVVAIALLVVVGGAGLFVLTFDPNSYKGWIEDLASDALGQRLRLEGPIELTRSSTPTVVVNGAVLEDQATGETLARVGRAEVALALPALLSGQIHLPKIAIADVTAKLPLALPPSPAEEDTPDRPPGPLRLPRIDRVDISNVQLDQALGDGRELALVIEEAAVRPGDAETVIQLTGRIGDLPLAVDGSIGPVDALFAGVDDLPASLTAQWGQSRFDAEGTLELQAGGRSPRYDLELTLEVPTIAEPLAALGQEPLPLESLSAALRLLGSETFVEARSLMIRADQSDLNGDVVAAFGSAKPTVTGQLRAERIDLAQLLAADDEADAGAETVTEEELREAAPITEAALLAEDLIPVDLRLDLSVGRLDLPGRSLEAIEASAEEVDGRFTFTLHQARLAGSTVTGEVLVDGTQTPTAVRATFALPDADVAELVALTQAGIAASGRLDLAVDYQARGDSLRDLAETLTGQLSATAAVEVPIDDQRTVAVQVERATFDLAQGDSGLVIDIGGSVDDIPITISGNLPRPTDAEELPFDLEVVIADARLDWEGVASLGGQDSLFHYTFDLAIDLPATAEIAALAALPPLPPATLKLRGRDSEGAALIEDIALTVGQSEITGGLTYRTSGPRPELAGALHARHIDLAELLPAEGQAEEAPAKAGDGRVIPAIDMPLGSRLPLDLDLAISAEQIVAPQTTIENLEVKIEANSDRLHMELVNADLLGGTVALDYAADEAEAPPAIGLTVGVESVDINEVMGSDIRGEADLDVTLEGRGADLRTVLAGAGGRVEAATGDVFIANRYASMVGQSVVTALLPTFGEEAGLRVFCAVVRMNVIEGKAATDGFVIDAERLIIGGGGGIDLATEALDLLIVPEAKRASIVPLVAPVHLQGTLAAPTLTPDAADLIISAPTSIAFGLIQPWDLVIPLVVREEGSGMQPCIDAIENPEQSRSVFQQTGDAVTGTAGAVGGAVSDAAKGVGGLIEGLFGQ